MIIEVRIKMLIDDSQYESHLKSKKEYSSIGHDIIIINANDLSPTKEQIDSKYAQLQNDIQELKQIDPIKMDKHTSI